MTRTTEQPRSGRPVRTATRRWLTVLTVLALGLLVACTGSEEDAATSTSGEASGDSGGFEAPVSGEGGEPDQDEGTDADGEQPAAGTLGQVQLLADRKQILRADLVVESDSVLTDARRAEAAVLSAGGVVTEERTETDAGSPAGETVSTLTARVPPERLNELLAQLAELGTLVTQSRGTTDVTDDYVDVQARIESQTASLARLLALVTDASDLSDVVALENEVSQRQSDLDALTARLQTLDEQVTLATVTLTLTSHRADDVVASESGFVAGLRTGWGAFTGALVGGLTVFGALLPFLVTLAAVGVPLYVLRARRRTGSPPTVVARPPAA